MIYTNKIHKGVSALLFLFLFGYLLLRVLFNETLHDEIASFYFYFYHGNYIGKSIQWDANNHLLNSFLGAQLYRFFGDNFALLRLPNLFSFILFFWGSFKLTEQLKTPFLKLTGLLALTCIPFVLDYFAYARGYGLSMGFLMIALVHFVNYQQLFSKKSLFFTYFFLLLAVSANLTLVNSVFIILGINILTPFLQENRKNFEWKIWGIHFLFVVSLSPFILFAFLLKETGALYYGSLEGLWEVTGKTLSRMVFFSDGIAFKGLFLLLFVVFNFFFFRILKSTKKENWLKQPFVLWVNLLYGNVLGIIVLAWILKVNYPEDRTGMYLIFYTLLAVIYLLENIKWGKWVQWIFIFFPISLVVHLNLETSIFSPEQRMNEAFYSNVKQEIEPKNSIMIYNTMYWNWVFNESHQSIKSSVSQIDDPNTILTDIILTREEVLNNPLIPKLYDTIAYHQPSGYIAFKRKKTVVKTPIDSLVDQTHVGNGEYYSMGNFQLDSLVNKNIQIDVSGHLKTFNPKDRIMLVVQTMDSNDQTMRYYYYSFDACYQGKKIDDDFFLHFVFDNIEKKEEQFKIYLWNRDLNSLEMTNTKIVLLELEHFSKSK